MKDINVKEYARLINKISLSQKDKEQIIKNLIAEVDDKREISGKYIAVASVFAVLAVGAVYAVKGLKQDKFNVR